MACDIKKKLDANVYSFGHLALKLLLRYLVKCRGRSLTIDWVVHTSAQKITETTKSLKICYFVFNLKVS